MRCAIAAGAGTIYRNYFAPVNGLIGQTEANQIDCLADMGIALGNSGGRLWEMRNGYALASYGGLRELGERIQRSTESQLDELRRLLRIGVQWNAQVTLDGCRHTVSQTYCSALPVAYCDHPATLWAGFAGLVLEASYEATLCAARLLGGERDDAQHDRFFEAMGQIGIAADPLRGRGGKSDLRELARQIEGGE